MDRIPEPTNEHERTIAEVLDSQRLALGSNVSIEAQIVGYVPFDMSIADTQFLFNYAHWRIAQPVKRQLARVPEDL